MATTYTTVQGQMWDQIAKEVYGDEEAVEWLRANNLTQAETWRFDGGTVLQTPEMETTTAASSLPPWRQS